MATTGLIGSPRDYDWPALAYRGIHPSGSWSRRRLRASGCEYANQAENMAILSKLTATPNLEWSTKIVFSAIFITFPFQVIGLIENDVVTISSSTTHHL